MDAARAVRAVRPVGRSAGHAGPVHMRKPSPARTRADGSRAHASAAPLRIAMLAPPWISVPAPGYGGVESVVSTLTEELVRGGHDVTLFCAPGLGFKRPRGDAPEAGPSR